MKRILSFGLYCAAIFSVCACSGGSSNNPPPAPVPVVPTALSVSGVVAADGVFDPSPRNDGSSKLWMSYSAVAWSPNDPGILSQVRTRLATSEDGGATWSDLGVDPNNMADADFAASAVAPATGIMWVTWRFEVSSLLYDPYDSDSSRRWKMLWHRYPAADNNGVLTRVIQKGWIGMSSAPAPGGPWSAERNLFTGSWYDHSVDVIISAPEYPLDTLYPAAGQLSGCAAFTEPSMLAKPEGIYISLQCAGSPAKIIGLKCDRPFSSCTYLGDFLTESEAPQFNQGSQQLNGFAATEMVSVGSKDYLVVTPYEPPQDRYRGCLVFEISNLATATLVRSNGAPVIAKRISGTSGSFNGACGYDTSASASGIIYSEYNSAAPHFRLYASHVHLP